MVRALSSFDSGSHTSGQPDVINVMCGNGLTALLLGMLAALPPITESGGSAKLRSATSVVDGLRQDSLSLPRSVPYPGYRSDIVAGIHLYLHVYMATCYLFTCKQAIAPHLAS